jgi:DNA-binding response OmpR family regulator
VLRCGLLHLDDRDVASLTQDCLVDEDYETIILLNVGAQAVQDAVSRLEPDCVLLDSGAGYLYGDSWDSAAWMTCRVSGVPVIMFTAYTEAVTEAKTNTSPRSLAAGFAGVLSKPFEINDVVRLVSVAVGTSKTEAAAELAQAGVGS